MLLECVVCERLFEALIRGKFCTGCYNFFLTKRVLPTNVYPEMPKTLTAAQIEILDGTMLGDAHMRYSNKNKYGDDGVFLSIKRKPADRPYLEWQASFFKDFTGRPVHETTYKSYRLKSGQTIYTAVQFVSRSAEAFVDYYKKWYREDGKKIVPRDLKLTPIILCEWLCDDGSWIYKDGCKRLYLYTQGFTQEDCEFLHHLLEVYFNEKFCLTKGRVIQASKWPALLYAKEIDAILPPGMERKAKWRKLDSFYDANFGVSNTKMYEEFHRKFLEYAKNKSTFTAMELCLATGDYYMHGGRREPKYNLFMKQLKPFVEQELITITPGGLDKGKVMPTIYSVVGDITKVVRKHGYLGTVL